MRSERQYDYPRPNAQKTALVVNDLKNAHN